VGISPTENCRLFTAHVKEQILQHHERSSKIDLADAKYDDLHNYQFSRSHGAIPIIDYNPRNENRSSVALKEKRKRL